MNQQLTEEQAYELYRFNTAASQYAPGLYCSLHTSFCTYPAALGGKEFTASSVQVTCYQHPTADNTNNAAVASIPTAEDFDAAMVEMRRQLAARFGITPNPDDLLPITTDQKQRIKALANDPRITSAEKTLVLLHLNSMTRGQAKAKTEELQEAVDSRPLPSRRDRQQHANPAAVHDVA